MKKNPFTFIVSQIEANLPESIRPLSEDAKQMLRSVISEKLAQFDLVPREEFEQQERLLARAEQRVATLEARIAELEQRPIAPVHTAKHDVQDDSQTDL